MVEVLTEGTHRPELAKKKRGKEKRIEFNTGKEGTESLGMSASGQVNVTRTSFPSCMKQTNKTDRTDETVIVKTLDFRPQKAMIPEFRKPN